MAAVFHFIGEIAGMRALGVLVAGHAVALLLARRVPYGWERSAPSGYITGMPVKLIVLALAIVSVAMLVSPQLMLAMLGWH